MPSRLSQCDGGDVRRSSATARSHSNTPLLSFQPPPADAGTHQPHSTTHSAIHCSVSSSAAALCRNCVRRVSSIDIDEPYQYSGTIVPIKAHTYEYLDSSAALIGHGSYGIVFRGVDRGSHSVVAIKKMARWNVKPEELATMKRVRNPNLVSLIDVCDEGDDLTFLVMELCDNDLDRHLRRCATDGRLGMSELGNVIGSIAKGYYALYQQRIIHRDIKPQNILLLYSPIDGGIVNAKITDFGVSRILAESGESGLCSVAGTVLYMAPEVGANLLITSQYDSAADMWSIGCVIYQCWTGQLPFDENSLCRLFLYYAGGNFEAYEMPSLPEDTDHSLKFLIHSLLEIDAHKRTTPTQLHAAVHSHLLAPMKGGRAVRDEGARNSTHSLNSSINGGGDGEGRLTATTAHRHHLLSVRDGYGKSL